jgi:hypothetical protein
MQTAALVLKKKYADSRSQIGARWPDRAECVQLDSIRLKAGHNEDADEHGNTNNT